MPTVDDITILNIDDVAYDVAELSEEAQALVGVYNNWNRKENEAAGELAILQAAKQTLSAQIVAKVRADAAAKAEAEAAAASAEANVTEPPPAEDVVATPENPKAGAE